MGYLRGTGRDLVIQNLGVVLIRSSPRCPYRKHLERRKPGAMDSARMVLTDGVPQLTGAGWSVGVDRVQLTSRTAHTCKFEGWVMIENRAWP